MTELSLPESSVAVNFDGALLSVAVSLQQKEGKRMHQATLLRKHVAMSLSFLYLIFMAHLQYISC